MRLLIHGEIKLSHLFAQLAESEALTDDDLAEIEALLREMRK